MCEFKGLTVLTAASSLGFEVDTIKGLLLELGGDASTSMNAFFMIPSADVQAAIDRLKVQGTSIAPLQKGKIIQVIRRLAVVAKVEGPALGAPLPSSTGVAGSRKTPTASPSDS